MEWKRKGKEMEGTQSHKTYFRFFQLFVGGHPWADSHKFVMRVVPHDVIKTSNMFNKIFGGFRPQGSKSPFSIDCWSLIGL